MHPFLDVRTAVLNDTLEEPFAGRYPGFRPANRGPKAAGRVDLVARRLA